MLAYSIMAVLIQIRTLYDTKGGIGNMIALCPYTPTCNIHKKIFLIHSHAHHYLSRFPGVLCTIVTNGFSDDG